MHLEAPPSRRIQTTASPNELTPTRSVEALDDREFGSRRQRRSPSTPIIERTLIKSRVPHPEFGGNVVAKRELERPQAAIRVCIQTKEVSAQDHVAPRIRQEEVEGTVQPHDATGCARCHQFEYRPHVRIEYPLAHPFADRLPRVR